MNLAQAIECIKAGNKVRRKGWNGKGMWLCYMPPCVIPEALVNTRTKAHGVIGDLKVGGYIVMFTADGTWQPGWLASQPDLLSEDWEQA